MTLWRRFWLAIGSGAFPGLGDGLLARRWVMLAWALGATVVPMLALWWPFMIWVALALHGACVIATFVTIGRPTPPAPAEPAEPAPPTAIVAGRVPDSARPRRSRPLAVTALVIGLVGSGVLKLSIRSARQASSSMAPTFVTGDRVMIDTLTYRFRAPRRDDMIVFDHPCASRQYLKRVVATAGQTVEVRCGEVYVDGAPLGSTLVTTDCEYEDHDGMENWYRRSCSEYAERGYRVYHAADRPTRKGEDTHDFPRADSPPPSCAADRYEPVTETVGELVRTAEHLDPDACTPQLHYVVPAGHLFVMGDNRANSNDSRYWGAVPVANVTGRVVGVYWSR